MRKSVVIIAVFLFSVSMFAGVTKSEFTGGVKYYFAAGGIEDLSMYTIPNTVNQLNYVNIPYVDYKFEIMLGKLFKIYAHPSIGYKFLKGTEDGTAPLGYDRYATEFYMSVKPMLKFYFPRQISGDQSTGKSSRYCNCCRCFWDCWRFRASYTYNRL